ncbi:MAG: twin-arginine translocation signal domain-containing protein [Gammaproteobacteria bacterium]|nr:twin-arginine translocation signal domain-containing protein [Gammaproteobacteria bacterium]
MKNTGKKLDKNRRDFIKKSTLAGAGVVAGNLVAGEAAAAVSSDDDQVQENKGYQLTEHVIEYYKSAAS